MCGQEPVEGPETSKGWNVREEFKVTREDLGGRAGRSRQQAGVVRVTDSRGH